MNLSPNASPATSGKIDPSPVSELSVPAPQPNPSAALDLDLDQIEARANAATAGPWKLSEPQGNWIWPHIANTYGSRRQDAEFIAHAREDVPALVAEVRRLREETEKWRDRMTEHSDCEHRNAAELRRLHAEADSLRRQLLSETYRPEGARSLCGNSGR